LLHAGLDPLGVDRVFFTHFDPDDLVDVVPLMFALKYASEEKREKPLLLYGPEPFEGFFGEITAVFGKWMLGGYPAEVRELPRECSSALHLPGGRLAWAPAVHRPESIAYRLEGENGAFVYTGDTEYAESVVDLARGAHTLLIECSFPDERPVPGHLTPSGVARVASEAGVGRVVLTHVLPPADETDLASAVLGHGYEGEVTVAEDGFEFSL